MSEWVWHGHAAHFIAASRCRFHMATTVAGGRFVVSTVGDYYPTPDGERETIGLTRYFETMVFPVDGAHDCGCPIITDHQEHDFMGYKTAQDATAGHMALCRKWDARAEAES